jgi:hypothetical protein
MKPDEIAEEVFLEFNHAVAVQPKELVVLDSIRAILMSLTVQGKSLRAWRHILPSCGKCWT